MGVGSIDIVVIGGGKELSFEVVAADILTKVVDDL
jgi:hypothetical protein